MTTGETPCECAIRANLLRLQIVAHADVLTLVVRHGQLALTCAVCGRSVYVQFESSRERAVPPFVGLEHGT